MPPVAAGTGPRAQGVPVGVAKRRVKACFKKKGPSDFKGKQPAEDSDSPQESDSDMEDAEDYKKGGYHPVRVGEKYHAGKYTVLRKLGWGHFSTVWLVLNNQSNEYGAMKIQKSAKHYTEAALDEVTLLAQITDHDPDNTKHCVRLLDHFEHVGPNGRHVCMVFEVLGDNLLALIKLFNYKGVPIPIVRNLTRQMLIGLDYLHRELQVIHTDFKPENVMLCEPLHERLWELPDLDVHPLQQPSSSGQQGPATSSQTAATSGLNKNQKKKAKKKAKKAAAAGGAGGEGSGDDEGDGDDATEDSSHRAASQLLQGTGGKAEKGEVTSSDTAGQNGQAAANGNGHGLANGGDDLGERKEVLRLPGLTREQLATAGCKLVDFGNACWTYKQFTMDVQTRQYRSPEVILGAKYSTPCDLWSIACMLFELVTGDLMFDPRSGRDYERDEDHLAQFMELLGRMPKKVYDKGKYAPEFFNRHGDLRHIKKLRFWPMERVLAEKYRLPVEEAQALAAFLMPMLEFVPENRATAAEMLQHPWLTGDLQGAIAAGKQRGNPRVGGAPHISQQQQPPPRSTTSGGGSANGGKSTEQEGGSRSVSQSGSGTWRRERGSRGTRGSHSRSCSPSPKGHSAGRDDAHAHDQPRRLSQQRPGDRSPEQPVKKTRSPPRTQNT